MPSKSADHCELTLHIVLATIPQKQEKAFNTTVIENHFTRYRNQTQKYCNVNSEGYYYCENDRKRTTPILYNPLRYYILGNYDIAYISLIDNFKFAQRLFEPGNDKKVQTFTPHTFQSFSGINTHDSKFLRSFFYEHLEKEKKKSKYFLGICNLKLNNRFSQPIIISIED